MPDFVTYYFEQIKDTARSVADPLFAYQLLVHGPALMAIAALLLVLALSISLGKSPALRYTAMVFFGLAALAAVGVWQTHNSASIMLEQVGDELAQTRFDQLLQWAWVAPALACLALLMTVGKGSKLRASGLIVGVLLAGSAVISGALVSYNHIVVHEPELAQAIKDRQTLRANEPTNPSDQDEPESGPDNPNEDDPGLANRPADQDEPEEEEGNTLFGVPVP